MRSLAWFLCALLPPSLAVAQSPNLPPEIPPSELQSLYATELGPAYSPQQFDSLHTAHRQLERYFATTQPTEKQLALASIAQANIPPDSIARLARLHLTWPDLLPGAYFVNDSSNGQDIRYFLGVPPSYKRSTPMPLVIQLPTAHAFLTTPPPNADQVATIYREWTEAELVRHPDALVLMPLLNLDELYGPSYFGMSSVSEPLWHAGNHVNIDPTRVYLLGHSMGAHATWNLGLHFTTYFAAIMPLAGAVTGDWQRLRLPNLREVLPVVWHDSEDSVIPVDRARSVVSALHKLDYDVEYEETHGVGHTPPQQVVDRLYALMRARSRRLYPQTVTVQSNRPDPLFNRVDWLQLDRSLEPGKEYRITFAIGSGAMMTHEHTFRADATIAAPNRIEVKTDNVAAFRIYLSNEMVDFTKHITVIVNNKTRFQGLVIPDLQTTLADQDFLGRGWRNFTAVIKISFDEPSTATHPTTRGKITVGP